MIFFRFQCVANLCVPNPKLLEKSFKDGFEREGVAGNSQNTTNANG